MQPVNQPKTIEFGVYKYEHPSFGPIMLLLDVGQVEEKELQKAKQPSIYRFRDDQPESKINNFNRYDFQEMESIDHEKKRSLSHKPPIPVEKKINKLQIGGASLQKIERRSLQRKAQEANSHENNILLPSIVKKR